MSLAAGAARPSGSACPHAAQSQSPPCTSTKTATTLASSACLDRNTVVSSSWQWQSQHTRFSSVKCQQSVESMVVAGPHHSVTSPAPMGAAPPVRAPHIVARAAQASAAARTPCATQKRPILSQFLSCVCPEPVLVNQTILFCSQGRILFAKKKTGLFLASN